jgi:hypothetical protein
MPESVSKALGAASKIVGILQPLMPEERQKAVSAALVLLGDELAPTVSRKGVIAKDVAVSEGPVTQPKVKSWMDKNGLTSEHLDHVFSFSDKGVEVIAARAPGSSKRQQTVEAYVLCGLAHFLHDGSTTFKDEDARAVCKKLGAYDSPNHSNYMKAMGNSIGGSKDGAWSITNPGLSKAAQLVKQLLPEANV